MNYKRNIYTIYACLTLTAAMAMAQPASRPSDADFEEYKSFEILRQAAISVLDHNLECERDISAYIAANDTPIARFTAAKVAWLIGRPAVAIALLEEVRAKHGNEPVPAELGTGIMTDMVCNLWIASIARQSGDARRARRAYDDLLNVVRGRRDLGTLAEVIVLYRMELDLQVCNDASAALSHMQEATKGGMVIDEQRRDAWEMYRDWIAFQELVIQKKADSNANLRPQRFKLDNLTLLSMGHLVQTGILAEPRIGMYFESGEVLHAQCISLAIEGSSDIDRTMARLALAGSYQQRKEYDAAGKLYAAVFDDQSFFSPEAGLMLAWCQGYAKRAADAAITLQKVQQRFPAYAAECKKIESELKTASAALLPSASMPSR